MRVEQAIFTSVRTAVQQGYHLAARSSGIESPLAQSLRQWSPSHGSLFDQQVNATSINGYTLGPGWFVVSRTMYGAPEYSGRGALQMVTVILTAHQSQLDGFDNSPLLFARTALTLGFLRLPATIPTRLHGLTLPDRALTSTVEANRDPRTLSESTLSRSLRLLDQGQRIALVTANPLGAVTQLLARIPSSQRGETSFTTGLRPSRQRPFQVHVVPGVNAELRQRLLGQGIQLIAEKL